MGTVEQVIHCQNTLGEGSLWSVEQQMLYWVDITEGRYWRYDPASGQHESIDVGTPIGVLAERASGGLVMATEKGFAYWDEQLRKLDIIATPEASRPHMRFNDGAVDCAGRFWAGSVGGENEGVLYRLDPDGSVHVMVEGISVSNGIGWSPDNTIMYYTDSPKRVIYTFEFDAATGDIANQRVLVHTPDAVSQPDGLAVDAEGYIWSAQWEGAKLVRYAPDGTIDRVIAVPAHRVTSCVFGGPALDTLYITSANVDAELKQQYPLSGDLFRLKVDVKGLPKYAFGG